MTRALCAGPGRPLHERHGFPERARHCGHWTVSESLWVMSPPSRESSLPDGVEHSNVRGASGVSPHFGVGNYGPTNTQRVLSGRGGGAGSLIAAGCGGEARLVG